MEDPCKKAKEWLQSLQAIDINITIDPASASSSLDASTVSNIYEGFVFRGLQVQQLELGRIICTFKVPSHLTDERGHWRASALMTVVDNICAAAIMTYDQPIKVSVDFNLSYIRAVKSHEEIEMDARLLGHMGGLSTVVVDLRNKTTGEIVAQARQSMHPITGFTKPLSKI